MPHLQGLLAPRVEAGGMGPCAGRVAAAAAALLLPHVHERCRHAAGVAALHVWDCARVVLLQQGGGVGV